MFRAAEPASPTAPRSDSRWMIAMFAIPYAWDSFHWACIRLNNTGEHIIRQASS
jgi:hypothetical protein